MFFLSSQNFALILFQSSFFELAKFKKIFELLIVLLIIAFMAESAISQQYIDSAYTPRLNFGIYGHGGINLHMANFSELPGIPSCCPRYETGTGLGYGFGIFGAYPATNTIESFIRVGYLDYSGILKRSEPELLAGPDGRGVQGEFLHTVNAKLSVVEFFPGASFLLSERARIYAGIRFGFLIQNDYTQKEEITKPDFGVFADTRTRSRNEYSGEIPKASQMIFGLGGGASYDFPLNKAHTLFISPMANIHFGLSSFAENTGWRALSASLGFSIKFAPRRKAPPPPLPPPLPTMPEPDTPAKPLLAVYAVTITDDGRESPVSTFRQEEFLTTQMHPLLNYIFFEDNSADLPPRYKLLGRRDASLFDFNKLFNHSTIDVYHHVLNIVGSRMKQFPSARINLIGNNSNAGREQNNIELSKRRAESVRDYLINVWGVESERITVSAQNLPRIPSNPNSKDGIEENRRVEIIASQSEIFKPLVINDTLRESNIPVVRFKLESLSESGLTDWRIETIQAGKPLRVFRGKGSTPEKVEWNLKIENEYIPGFESSIEYLLTVKDKDGFEWQSGWWALPAEKVSVERKAQEMVEDKRIDRFSLILFDFNQATLGAENQKIADIARQSIQPNSVVTIKGYTDRVGDDKYNLDLSRRRALAVSELLGLSSETAVGLGKSHLLFDNNLPEGRIYCRTVTIEVVTTLR